MPVLSRRKLLKMGAASLGSFYVSSHLTACNSNSLDEGYFNHGVASGDPLPTSVILWTRVSPVNTTANSVKIEWQVYEKGLKIPVVTGSGTAKAEHDFTVKVDIQGLKPGTEYEYFFRSKNASSTRGTTRTLPESSNNKLKLAVISCSNYPAGYFHVYSEIANTENLDLVLHLGDYIYEYGATGYATEQAVSMGRVPQPEGELVSLEDYRTRYAQYRSDSELQKAHASVPFIVVWDDHEVANDSWREGAENHNINDQGSYETRRAAAIQAYFEWLPIRPIPNEEGDLLTPSSIYRHFQWGDLANILMLDTRHEDRDEPLALESFLDTTTNEFDFDGLTTAINGESRQLIGKEQLDWLDEQLSNSNATWQILGQQILMGRMYLPAAIATQTMSIPEYVELGHIARLAERASSEDPALTAEELSYLEQNQNRLTPEVLAWLTAPGLPYNLDAWDGYGAERERVFSLSKSANANLVVLAGDTHNAWANHLKDAEGNNVGVELATSSVSSPGLESYLNLPPEAYDATEAGLVSLIQDLQYMNISDRGMLILELSHGELRASWIFVSSVKASNYAVLSEKGKTLTLLPNGHHTLI